MRDDAATLALAGLTAVVVVLLDRLFAGSVWLPYGFGAAAVGHVAVWALRRLGVNLFGGGVACVALTILVPVWLVLPQATFRGLPTWGTLDAAGTALEAMRATWGEAVAPVAPTHGYLLAATGAVVMVAVLGDWAAFRMRTAFEAVLPALVLFVVSAVLGPRQDRWLTVGLFAVAALVFLVVQRANLDSEHTAWFGGRSRGALPHLLAVGVALGVVATGLGVWSGPQVPGAESSALVKLKGRGPSSPGTRTTVSPLVDIKGRLVEFADQQVFTVQADAPAYWRLTSLDTFDGTIWSSNEKYRSARTTLPAAGSLAGTPLEQRFRIDALRSIWLPAAYRPARLPSGTQGFSFSADSASLISREATSDGQAYTVVSNVASPTPEQLATAPVSTPATSDLGPDLARYTRAPLASNRVRALAHQLTRNQATPYAKAKAIQDHLRTFRYTLDVRPGHDASAVDRFLFVTRAGYCEQFAGTFALLARLAGLPTRVAVGFQPGAADGAGGFVVKDRDAHAWPEVYLEGYGWMAFEPTPSAGGGSTGNPAAQSYTGVPYRPRAESGPTTPTTQPPGPGAAEQPTPDTVAPDLPGADAGADGGDAAGDRGGVAGALRWLGRVVLRLLPVVLLLGAAIVVGVGSIAVKRSRRLQRRRAATTPEDRVAVAWEEAAAALSDAGVHKARSETLAEFRDRLGRPGGGAAAAAVEPTSEAGRALRRLADTVAAAAYTAGAVGSAVADRAEHDRDVVVRAAHGAVSRWRRLLAEADPRPLLARRG